MSNVDQDRLLLLSESDWLQEQARFCIDLYNLGLKYDPWTKERADLWYESLILFVDVFIKPEFPVPPFHNDWYYWSISERAYLNLSPRDHAKTTVHSVIRTTWEICCNRNITFFIIFATTDVAKLVLSQIKSQLTQNPRITQGFGIFNPMDLPPEDRLVDQDWSQNSITVNRSDFSLKDPTVAVAGSLTNVLSRRVHRLIADDLLTDKIAFSESESARLESWYFNDVQPVLRAEGQEIITGTRYRPGDFYDGIINKSKEDDGLYRVFVGDAIIDEDKQEVLWPERWNWESLMRQRAKMGIVRFNRNYRNIIISDEDSTFPMIWFTGGVDKKTGIYYKGCFNQSYSLGKLPRAMVKWSEWLRFIVVGVDPAIGESKRSKFFGLIVLGISYDNHLVIAEIIRKQLSFPAQKRLVSDINNAFKPRYVVVESNAYQKALAEGLFEENINMNIVPFFSTGGEKTRPELGVPSMDIYFEIGRFLVPRGDERSIKMTDLLVHELHHWGRATTSDLAMGLWFAFERMRPEIERASILPPAKNVIKGDRMRYERQLIRGASGVMLPRRSGEILRNAALNNTARRLLPLLNRRRRRIDELR